MFKKDKLALLKRAAAVAQLDQIFLDRLRTVCDRIALTSDSVSISHKWLTRVMPAGNATAAFETTFRIRAIQKKKTVLLVLASFRSEYRLPFLSPPLTDDEINAFADVNVPYHVFPYWRELLQSLTGRMGLPPLTLPVFRVRDIVSGRSLRGSPSNQP